MRTFLLLVATLAACGGGSSGSSTDAAGTIDGPLGAADAGGDGGGTADAAPPGGGILFVTKSPAGPGNGDPANWDGVIEERIAGNGAAPVALTGIAKDAVRDPASVVYRAAGSEILVGNRHGNNAADGTAGSIDRFTYDPSTGALTQGTPILGNGLAGVHQVAISPTTGELFAANVGTGVSRFTMAGDAPTANGTISDGLARGVMVSPSGATLWVSTASSTIRVFDLASGVEGTPVVLGGATKNLHYFALRDGELYVAALDTGEVYRFPIGDGDVLGTPTVIDAPSPIAITFSQDGGEMYVTGHRDTFVISRFAYRGDGDTWEHTGDLTSDVSLGGITMAPTN